MNPCDHKEKFLDNMCLDCWTKEQSGQVEMLKGAIEGWRSENERLQSELDQMTAQRDRARKLAHEYITAYEKLAFGASPIPSTQDNPATKDKPANE